MASHVWDDEQTLIDTGRETTDITESRKRQRRGADMDNAVCKGGQTCLYAIAIAI